MPISGFLTRSAMRHPASGLGARVRAWVWALVALMLVATLAPAISRTLDHGKPLHERGWVEVCSAQGMGWVQNGLGNPSAGAAPVEGLLTHLDACGHCVLATDRGTPPPSFDGWGLTPSTPPLCPVWAGHTLLTSTARQPLARGPPAST